MQKLSDADHRKAILRHDPHFNWRLCIEATDTCPANGFIIKKILGQGLVNKTDSKRYLL